MSASLDLLSQINFLSTTEGIQVFFQIIFLEKVRIIMLCPQLLQKKEQQTNIVINIHIHIGKK